ncbi:hypothetical protein F4782DRAFT_172973 [Xylaria castorea]|nr:hypothetical protein F4782DRAFT_172973 [Xylaria castorea]
MNLPPSHPVFYGDEPSAKGHSFFSSEDEKDRCFVAEQYFREVFQEIPPWQLGPMTRTLQFSDRGFVPGGHVSSLSGEAHIHRLIYDTERIQVDENSWFPFFKKDRWFGSRANEPSLLSGDCWSVDDPKVWRELSIALELANRILVALIKDKHPFLHTLLFGKLMYWERARELLFPAQPPAPKLDTIVLLSHRFYKRRFLEEFPHERCDMDSTLHMTDQQYRDGLISLGLQQDWALVVINHEPRMREGGRTFINGKDMIFLNVDPIRSLIKDNITLAERLTLVYEVANTILHELSHALMSSRVRQSSNQKIEYLSEPFINFFPQAEMGYAMEALVFGGPIRHVLQSGPDDILLAPHRVTWPFPSLEASSMLGQVILGHPSMAAGIENKLTLIPSLWYSMMLSEAFWRNGSIPKKSANYFHCMHYFCSRIAHRPGVDLYMYRGAPVMEGDPPRTNRGVAEMIANWKLREKLWNRGRAGWYDKEHGIWAKSAWGMVNARPMITDFTKLMNTPFAGRDMYLCARYAILMTGAVAWGGGRDRYIANVQSPAWVHHAIGLLMLACVPLRPYDKRRPQPPSNVRIHEFVPSSGRLKPRDLKGLEQGEQREPLIIECAASVYHDPLGRGVQGVIYSKGTFNHFSYLDLVLRLIKHFADNLTVVTTPWLDEILRVEDKIRTYRTNAALAGGDADPDLTWACEAWDFRIPEYDPTAISQWNAGINGWAPVAPFG